MDEFHSKDIDWEEDFTIAEIMYKYINSRTLASNNDVLFATNKR